MRTGQILNQVSAVTLLFWFGLGMLIVSGIIFACHHPNIRKKFRTHGIRDAMLSGSINAMALLVYFFAIKTGFVTLTASLLSLRVLFVFLLATTLSKIYPHIIREKTDRKDLMLKLTSAVLAVIGSILVIA